MSTKELTPVLYIPHGGGPLPLLGEPGHKLLVSFLKSIPEQLGNPKAILLVSAHWEEEQPTIINGPKPELIYDYYNFPPEAYKIQYPAQGAPDLALKVQQVLTQNEIQSSLDSNRGFDHGMFIPLKLMYPNADIPCIQVSLMKHLDPAVHINLGKALASLREEGVLIIGSGSSYHNMVRPRPGIDPTTEQTLAWDRWLIETCTSPSLISAEREARLRQWLDAPYARFCHPREEHLLPLQVCFGAAFQNGEAPAAQKVFDDAMMGRDLQGFLWP